ncbi:MAG: hypothetical protein EOM66_00100 [Clostridia bacterium]|nr:hypothetical protein [Candidatus Pelethousia sp.]NCB29790.1 hypothetical protein [Clostridia bacterium]
MREFGDKSLSWDTIGRLKAQADAWQDAFTQKCSRALRENGSLGDEALCAESTELENFMYSIMDMEKVLLARETECGEMPDQETTNQE